MIKFVVGSVFFLMTLIGCSADEEKQISGAKNDFDLFCEQFTIMTESPGFSSLTSEQRSEKLNGILVEKIEQSGPAYNAWVAIRNGPPSDRYSLYKEAAASVGYMDWKCPAVELHGSEVGSSHH